MSLFLNIIISINYYNGFNDKGSYFFLLLLSKARSNWVVWLSFPFVISKMLLIQGVQFWSQKFFSHVFFILTFLHLFIYLFLWEGVKNNFK